MIVGIGVDVCSIQRMRAALNRRPGMVEKLFTPAESRPAGQQLDAASLAARFAAKEALAKALGAPAGLRWRDCEVRCEQGAPAFQLSGTVAAAAAARGVQRVHVSLSHDGDTACAFVVCESLEV